MILEKITVIGFKNIATAELTFCPKFNCFTGANGSGKTNLLDSIYVAALCKSAFGLSDAGCVRHGDGFYLITARFGSVSGSNAEVTVSFKSGSPKVLKRDGKEYERLSDHIGAIPLVLVSPYDTSLIQESGEDRRRYLNTLISQFDRSYLSDLVKFNQLLAQRNKLLKQFNSSADAVLEVLDAQMSSVGSRIYERRAQVISELSPRVSEFYARLSGGREQVGLHYRSQLQTTDYNALLQVHAERDRFLQYTSAGIHRDDLVMSIEGFPIRKYGSQGQQKTFLVALKLAQYQQIKQVSGNDPLLLLDDVFDKLDRTRVTHLMETVSSADFGQIFITDSNRIRLQSILEPLDAVRKLFEVSDGSFQSVAP